MLAGDSLLIIDIEAILQIIDNRMTTYLESD